MPQGSKYSQHHAGKAKSRAAQASQVSPEGEIVCLQSCKYAQLHAGKAKLRAAQAPQKRGQHSRADLFQLQRNRRWQWRSFLSHGLERIVVNPRHAFPGAFHWRNGNQVSPCASRQHAWLFQHHAHHEADNHREPWQQRRAGRPAHETRGPWPADEFDNRIGRHRHG